VLGAAAYAACLFAMGFGCISFRAQRPRDGCARTLCRAARGRR
jgi:hypothetical protein